MQYISMKKFLLTAIALFIGVCAFAQDASSSSSVVRRKASDRNTRQDTPGVTQRMQNRLESSSTDDSELQWMRVMYRSLDLTKDANGALYYPDEPVEGQDNLFRIIMKRMADGSLRGYEYLDGREVFSDDFKVNMRDVLDRFYILYSEAKGSTEKNPRFTIEESDIPASEVLSYYIIERWEFDLRSNRMRTLVEAICPVLHRAGDFGAEAIRYPMFWVRYDDLRPYITTQNIFTDDDNNLATCTYDDYFRLGLYEGDIYKTRNLKTSRSCSSIPIPMSWPMHATAYSSVSTTMKRSSGCPRSKSLPPAVKQPKKPRLSHRAMPQQARPQWPKTAWRNRPPLARHAQNAELKKALHPRPNPPRSRNPRA